MNLFTVRRIYKYKQDGESRSTDVIIITDNNIAG